jgi:hypothetical protein
LIRKINRDTGHETGRCSFHHPARKSPIGVLIFLKKYFEEMRTCTCFSSLFMESKYDSEAVPEGYNLIT